MNAYMHRVKSIRLAYKHTRIRTGGKNCIAVVSYARTTKFIYSQKKCAILSKRFEKFLLKKTLKTIQKSTSKGL